MASPFCIVPQILSGLCPLRVSIPPSGAEQYRMCARPMASPRVIRVKRSVFAFMLQHHTRDAPHFIGSLVGRSEEHTSELQSRRDLVCRLLLEKKNLLLLF